MGTLLVSTLAVGCGSSGETEAQGGLQEISAAATTPDEGSAVYIASPVGVDQAPVVEVDLPDEFPRDIPRFAYGTLIAANVYPMRSYTASWRADSVNLDQAMSYIQGWKDLGFAELDSGDLTTDERRVLTYRLVRADMNVGISAVISKNGEGGLISIAGSWK